MGSSAPVTFLDTNPCLGGDSAMTLLAAQGLVERGRRVRVAAQAGSRLLREIGDRCVPVPGTGTHLSPEAEGFDFGVAFVASDAGFTAKLRKAASLARSLPELLRLRAWIRAAAGGSLVTTTRRRSCLYLQLLRPVPTARLALVAHHPFDHDPHPVVRRAALSGARILAVSRHVAESFEAIGVERERIAVVYNGVDVERFNPDVDGAALRERFVGNGRGPVVSLVGRIDPWKGQKEAIEAVALLRQYLPSIRLVLVGGADNFVGYAAQLMEMVRARGLAENVCFAGHIDEAEEVYAASDLVLIASHGEGFGLTAVEALACGRPVVAVAAGGIREIVEDGVTGLAVGPRDPGAIAQACGKLLFDRELALDLAAEGVRRVRERFSSEAYLDRLEGALDVYAPGQTPRNTSVAGPVM